MTRQHILEEVDLERDHQDIKWGTAFDDRNTINDWVAYINSYASQTIGSPSHDVPPHDKREKLLKVAAIAVAAVEAIDRNGDTAPRHYD